MASHTSTATRATALQRHDGADQVRLYRATRRLPLWFGLLDRLRLLSAFVPHGLSRRQRVTTGKAEMVEELDEGDRAAPPTLKSTKQAPGDWLFPSFFLCMAVAALPLIGMHWTAPEGVVTWRAFADALVFSLPVIVPLPILFLGCLGLLALQPASRTPEALGFLGVAMLIGLAAMHALFA